MMNRKLLLCLTTMLLVVMLNFTFSSCSKDDDSGPQITIKNLTSIDWYDASIIFKESKDASSNIIKMVKIGDVEVGKSFTTTKEGTFFYIDAKNKRGKLFMSDIVYASDNTSVTSKDVLINL